MRNETVPSKSVAKEEAGIMTENTKNFELKIEKEAG